MADQIIKDFPVLVYGNLEKYNDVISKGRCRIFYKGANRNGTFITDEFAEKLLSTIPYAPVKGIFDKEEDDYTDHGDNRDEGRIYGVVPAEPNLAWEKHLDEDGIEREYACVDVLIYTALYAEASKIPGKSQSMELYSKSIKGDWKIISGKRYYVFEDACFLGLQALGDETEPCFEGAAFYSLYQSLKDLVGKLEENYNNFQNRGQGGTKMPSINFKMSDNAKFDALWSLLNVNYNEENNWAVEYGICDVYDEYAIVKNYVDNSFERIYYVKNDETDSLEITQRKKCFIVDIDEDEKAALEALHAQNNGTYANVDTLIGTINDLNAKISESNTKVEELNTQLSTLNTERDEVKSQVTDLNAKLAEAGTQYAAAQEQISALTSERDSLASYKKQIEDDAKKAVINNYSESLSEEILNTYLNNLDQYDIDTLDMKLTYELKHAHPEMFTKTPAPVVIIPKDDTPTGINSILAKYEKH